MNSHLTQELPANPWWVRLVAAHSFSPALVPVLALMLTLALPLAAYPVAALAQQAAAEPDTPLPAGLPAAVANAVRAAKLPASSVGFFVQDVTATKPALTLNPDKPMNPASVMKLVTTYAALELLGPSHVW